MPEKCLHDGFLLKSVILAQVLPGRICKEFESLIRSDSFERVAAEESLRKLRNSRGLIP